MIVTDIGQEQLSAINTEYKDALESRENETGDDLFRAEGMAFGIWCVMSELGYNYDLEEALFVRKDEQ